MKVTIRLFARFRDIAGSGDLMRDVPDGSTARDVWNLLAAEHPTLAPFASVSSCAVNEEYAKFETQLREGDDVAFLPPVSGG